MRRHQNIFTNCTGNSNLKTNLRKKYQSAQKLLDKKIRQYEQKYKKNQILEIERLNKHNPNEFWQHIKSLGSRKQNIIPMKVNTEEGVVDTTDEVLNEWQREFSNLYNHEPNDSEYDVNFFNQCQNRTLRFQLEPENHFINEPISYDEINNAVQELKLNKSPREDTIPCEILKLKPVVCLLYKLFHFCFANSIVPTAWLKGVITPIPKSTFKDPCMPLNYGGITLLSCMSKVHTKVLNKRIISYVEEGNILVEEQSGFRAHRSCLDNLFSLTSIIRNKNSKTRLCRIFRYAKRIRLGRQRFTEIQVIKYWNKWKNIQCNRPVIWKSCFLCKIKSI